MSLKDKIKQAQLPQHIAIIMDGNGRWAKKRGGIRLLGHRTGANVVNDVVEASVELGIKYITLYAFSTENWSRPQEEISGLMDILVNTIETRFEKLIKNNVRLNVIGDVSSLPSKISTMIKDVVEKSSKNTGLVLTIALSYSSRWEITEMVKQIATKAKNDTISIDSISDDTIKQHLSTFDMPDPELLIRTSGEYRISNFLLWQIAYTELYFTEKLWPDFTKEDLYLAIADYQGRERRFGKTGEQVKK